MAINFQYNKTSQQLLQKQLKVRLKALPTLKSKESALRLEVKKAKDSAQAVRDRIEQSKKEIEIFSRLWVEFPDIVKIQATRMGVRRIAGVKIPVLEGVDYTLEQVSLFNNPAWVRGGAAYLQRVTTLNIELALALKTVIILEYARKKTTQKVNLYEKVQIPGYEEAIRKIKRFMEDEENLSKASQKIVKVKLARQEAAA
jgi:V/A-type H+-transporting ATPase subunit D